MGHQAMYLCVDKKDVETARKILKEEVEKESFEYEGENVSLAYYSGELHLKKGMKRFRDTGNHPCFTGDFEAGKTVIVYEGDRANVCHATVRLGERLEQVNKVFQVAYLEDMEGIKTYLKDYHQFYEQYGKNAIFENEYVRVIA